MRNQVLLFLAIHLSFLSLAQKTYLDVQGGLRSEFFATEVLSGNVEGNVEARPFIKLGLRREFENNWVLPFGIGLQRHGNRTSVENGIDLQSQIHFQTFGVAYLGIARSFNIQESIAINTGLMQQLIPIITGKDRIVDAKNTDFAIIKVEEVRSYQSLNPISQAFLELNLKLNAKSRVYLKAGYYQGWMPLLQREINYSIPSSSNAPRTGSALITTRGSGFFSSFGILTTK